MYKPEPLILLLAGVLLPAVLSAQQTDTAAFYADKADTLQSTVFTASRKAAYLGESKGLRTEVISSAGLMKMACCNLAESFENSASVTVGYSDAVTGARQIRLLGLSGIYTQMLDESRPVMRGLSAPFGLSYIPGPWLESIQIAKGSPSVIGGVESLTGQVNTEHRKPTDEIPFFFNASMMSDTKADVNLASSLQLGPSLSTVLLAHADGNFMTHDRNGDGFADDPAMLQLNVASRWLYYSPDWQVRWGASLVSDSRQGGQEGYERDTFTPDGPWGTDIRNRNLDAYLKVGRPLRDDQSASIALVLDGTFGQMDAGFGGTAYLGKQRSGFVHLLYRNQVNGHHDFTAGVSANLDRYVETLYRPLPTGADNSFPERTEVLLHGGAYGEYTFHQGDLFSAIAGLRAEGYRGEGFRLVPRLTLKFQPVEALVVRANGSRGLRSALPLIDHIGVLSTGKAFTGDYLSHRMEDAWTFGGNATWHFSEDTYLSLDYFSTRFVRQLVVDYEETPGQIAFYPLEGASFSDSFQADFHAEPFTRFTLDMTARYSDARTAFRSRGLSEVPLLSRFKAVVNLQYKTRLSRWIFDFTASLNGPARVYDFMRDLRDRDGTLLYPDGRTPVYPLLYAQVTRRFKGFDLYVGGENLTDFRQQYVILGERLPDGGIRTAASDFDASAVWGPLMGLKVNVGIRVTLWKTV